MKTFHCTSLVIAGSMVTILVNMGLLMPAPSGVSVAKAVFDRPQFTKSTKTMVSSSKAALVKTALVDQSVQVQASKRSDGIDVLPASGPREGALVPAHLNYDFDAVLKGDGAVPRITLASLPKHLLQERESRKRKAMFLKAVLPLILQVNEQILEDRARLKRLRAEQRSNQSLTALDRLWLAVMAERYDTKRSNIQSILNRHDVVPPSLALAQAATESAWGASRFVREGNAMFGEWTFSSQQSGIVPSERPTGKTHRVRAFGSLSESIDSYVTNLNKHRAYKEFRALRAAMRRQGLPLDGMQLAGTLHRYSERGEAYVAELRAIISSNALGSVDRAKLSKTGGLEPLI